jgi:hypothetical protein
VSVCNVFDRAARMAHAGIFAVVWVPDSHLLGASYPGDERPDLTLKSLEEFVPEEWGLPPYSD